MTENELRAAFTHQVGMLRCYAARRLKRVRCTDTRADAVSEVVALAWERWRKLWERGTDPRTVAAKIAAYSLRSQMVGDTLASYHNTSDVLAPMARCVRGFHVVRPDGFEGRRKRTTAELVIDQRNSNPADQAGALVDWEQFRGGLLPGARALVDALLAGETAKSHARRIGRHKNLVGAMRRRLAEKWKRMGVDGQ